jgi:hypothetical protein
MEGIPTLLKLSEPWGLVLLATLIVILNVIFHAFKELFNRWHSRRSEENAAIDQALRPLLVGTSDLVARLVELLVQQGSRLQRERWEPLRTGPDSPALSVIGISRFHSTVVRVIAFLALRELFRRKTLSMRSRRLERIRFYLERKIPAAFKGNIFSAQILSTEEAEAIGEYFAPDSGIADLTVMALIEKINEEPGRTFFNYIGGHISVSMQTLGQAISSHQIPSSDEGHRILSLAHLAILLLDFDQDLEDTPHWEEHRIVLCGFLKKHNQTMNKRVFLYRRGDLESKNYLDTYSAHSIQDRFIWRPSFAERWLLKRSLTKRGKTHLLSHPVKLCTADGVHSQQDGQNERLLWNDDLATLVSKVNTFQLATRMLISLTPNLSVDANE